MKYLEDYAGLIFIVILVGFLSLICLSIVFPGDPQPEERITLLARGELLNIRNTGAWHIKDTELKFSDGRIVLVSYQFVKQHDIREGEKYKISRSNLRGMIVE